MVVSKKRVRSSGKKHSKAEVGINVYRETINPVKKRVSITLPDSLVGKTVEVFAFESDSGSDTVQEKKSKPFSKKAFWETFGSGKNSKITADKIREQAWRRTPW